MFELKNKNFGGSGEGEHLQLRCGVLLVHAESADHAEFSCARLSLYSVILLLCYPFAQMEFAEGGLTATGTGEHLQLRCGV
jgi:hypothetical protein